MTTMDIYQKTAHIVVDNNITLGGRKQQTQPTQPGTTHKNNNQVQIKNYNSLNKNN